MTAFSGDFIQDLNVTSAFNNELNFCGSRAVGETKCDYFCLGRLMTRDAENGLCAATDEGNVSF